MIWFYKKRHFWLATWKPDSFTSTAQCLSCFMSKISHSKLESCKLQCFILVFVKILCFYCIRYDFLRIFNEQRQQYDVGWLFLPIRASPSGETRFSSPLSAFYQSIRASTSEKIAFSFLFTAMPKLNISTKWSWQRQWVYTALKALLKELLIQCFLQQIKNSVMLCYSEKNILHLCNNKNMYCILYKTLPIFIYIFILKERKIRLYIHSLRMFWTVFPSIKYMESLHRQWAGVLVPIIKSNQHLLFYRALRHRMISCSHHYMYKVSQTYTQNF